MVQISDVDHIADFERFRDPVLQAQLSLRSSVRISQSDTSGEHSPAFCIRIL